MATSQTLECNYSELENLLVGSIRFELIRVAKRGGASPATLMGGAIDAAIIGENHRRDRFEIGKLGEHLANESPPCYARLVQILIRRMEKVECPSMTNLIRWTCGRPVEEKFKRHMEKCRHCQRDSRLIRSGLPDYSEFP